MAASFMTQRAWRLVALTAAYYAAGYLGLKLAFINSSTTAVWPPTGIAIAALLVWGLDLWPAVYAGAFLVNLTTSLEAGAGLPVALLTSLGIALGNTLEGLVAALLVRKYAGGIQAFQSYPNVFRFAALGALLSTTISATIGVLTLVAGGLAEWSLAAPIWLTWWLGDAAGALIVAPFLILWARDPRVEWTPKQGLEAAGIALSVAVAGLVLFGPLPPFGEYGYPVSYLALPLVLWPAFRFTSREATSAAVLLGAISLWGTLRGWGPFAPLPANQSLLLLQSYLGMLTVLALGVGALVGERRRVESELRNVGEELDRRVRHRTSELEVALRNLESFSYTVSHDLRAPLRAIDGYAQILAETQGDRLDEEAREHLKQVRAAAGRMNELIRDLLELSRVSRHEARPESVDLSRIARAVAHELETRDPARRIEWRIQDGLVISGDSHLLRVALENLLENAWKFSRPRDVARIEFGVQGEDGQRVFFVRDNGAGFDPKATHRLFVPFHRLHLQSEFEGTGIGLASVFRVVQRHQGRIWAEGAVDQGATFYFTLGAVGPTPGPAPDVFGSRAPRSANGRTGQNDEKPSRA